MIDAGIVALLVVIAFLAGALTVAGMMGLFERDVPH
jgi:hypothetical protein